MTVIDQKRQLLLQNTTGDQVPFILGTPLQAAATKPE
jgi:hypothetical protein